MTSQKYLWERQDVLVYSVCRLVRRYLERQTHLTVARISVLRCTRHLQPFILHGRLTNPDTHVLSLEESSNDLTLRPTYDSRVQSQVEPNDVT